MARGLVPPGVVGPAKRRDARFSGRETSEGELIRLFGPFDEHGGPSKGSVP